MTTIVMCLQCFRNFLNSIALPNTGWFLCYQCLSKSYMPAERAETLTHTR